MTDRGDADAENSGTGSKSSRQPSSRDTLRAGLLLVIVAAVGLGVLVAVWQTVGNQDHRETLSALRTSHDAENPLERANAIRELVRFGADDGQVTIPSIIASLRDPDPEVRVEAARSLGSAASTSAMRGDEDALVKVALDAPCALEDNQPGLRSAAVNALGSIAITRSPSGVIEPQSLTAVFRKMLKDKDAMVRAEAIAAIGRAAPASERATLRPN